jgi:thiamine-monophosphate kinase
MSTLATLGETGLLDLLTRRWEIDRRRTLVGVGDDCAVLRGTARGHTLLFKTDVVVEGVHFLARTKPRLIGRKALCRALSDIAAMGGSPLAAVITLGLPPRESPRRLKGIYDGLTRAAKTYGVDLVGGETTRARELFLNIALLGECRGHAPVLRAGAKAGDLLAVTGTLGATRARKHLYFEPRLAEGAWLAREGFASAMMDLSDGLGADLPRFARASGVSLHLEEETIPRSRGASLKAALDDGEDFELLFTVPPHRAESLKKKWPFHTPLHFIGRAGRHGERSAFLHDQYGFDHFK